MPELERLKLARILLGVSESSMILSEDVEPAWNCAITRRPCDVRTGEARGVRLAQVERRIEAGFES